MSATPDSTLANPEQFIADLQRQLAECKAERDEALQRETATAEVLQVINSSPGDLAPVFDAILEKAHALCGAPLGSLVICDGEQLRAVATRGYPKEYEALARQGFSPTSAFRRLLSAEPFVHVPDPTTPGVSDEDLPIRRAAVEIAGIRTALFVPLRKDATVLGYISAQRQEVRPFTDKQIALLQNFAAQAVIAMENARLITETREALEQQTATAEVLQVINSSPGDLAPVFDAMLERATNLCDADFGILLTYQEGRYRAAAFRNVPPAYAALLREPIQPGAKTALARIAQGEPVAQIADIAADEELLSEPMVRGALDVAGFRTVLAVPLRAEYALLGAFTIYRREVRPFSDKQIALLQNFAAQAVIAMENARLLTETREALEQQTATAEVLQVINSSPGDLAPVFDAMLEKALHLCEADLGGLYRFDGKAIHPVAARSGSKASSEILQQSFVIEPGSSVERLVRGEDAVVQVRDIVDTEAYRSGAAYRVKFVELTGARTALWVALRKDETLIGVFVIYRQEVRPFSDKQIALLQNFAAQAVIAMENARLITETREALDQQTATAEVLGVINSSPGDLAPVFDAMLEKAMRLCEAGFGLLASFDGEAFHAAALNGVPAVFAESWREPRRPSPGLALYQLMQGEDLVHVPDVTAEDAYRSGNPIRRALADLGGARTGLWIALRKDAALLGAFVIYRQEIRPFSEKQIALLQNFAAQAVIAMENARLITETREALEQQTATAEVLQVINSSPGDLAAVFDAMLDKAMRLCDAAHGHLALYDGEVFRAAAVQGKQELVDWFRQRAPWRSGAGTTAERIIDGERVVHIADVMDDDAYREGNPVRRALVEIGGCRTTLSVALRRDNALLGMFTIYRTEVRPFTDKQIALLQNFAAQAVIAMENARLITETREALAQQTATAEVLQVINSSPGDLVPVFDAMLEKAVRLCEASFGIMFTVDGESARIVAERDLPQEFSDFLAQYPPSISPDTFFGRAVIARSVRHTSDIRSEAIYRSGQPLATAAADAGVRALLMAPLLKDDGVIGVFAIFRREVRPFSDKQIALLQNFAAQAVIAMENARLITETREALEQQTATAEVLGVINSSPGDLAPVFDAILEKAHTLCGAASGSLQVYDGEQFRAVADRGLSEAVVDRLRQGFRPGAGQPMSRLLDGDRFVQIRDLAEADDPFVRAGFELGGMHTVLAVPLRKDDALLGAIVATRPEVRLFSDKEIALLENFAAQAVIAMENARLITETREALDQQTATAEVLQVINSSPGDLAPVFDAMLEKAMRLCEAAFGTLWTLSGDRFQPVAHRGVPELYAEYLAREVPAAGPGTGRARLLAGEHLVHTADLADEEPYRTGEPHRRALVDLGGARTGLIVPLRKDAAVIGFIMIYRQEVRPFSDKQIALLQNFAAQAVIAMENARLITETREALEQQTATAEVLGVINSSPGELTPVFDAMLDRATRLSEASFGILWTFDGEFARAGALHRVPAAYAELCRAPFRPSPGSGPARLMRGEDTFAIVDLTAYPPYRDEDPLTRAIVDLAGARSVVIAPLRKDAVTLGAITVYRQEVRPFTDKQIALLENFAAQAVIAMENARLITETREALEQQTATAEVLQVINSSPGNLAPVFDAILEKARILCGATFGALFLSEEGHFRAVALRGGTEAWHDRMRHRGFQGSVTPISAPLLAGEAFVHVVDMAQIDHPMAQAAVEAVGVRSLLAVPLRKDDTLCGIIVASRPEVRAFTDKEIALLQNFAAQAVIAMENARLITETREALEQQTATAEVLQVINSSPGDLAPVFDTILEKAHDLCGASHGALATYDGEHFRAVAAHELPAPFADLLRQPFRPEPASPQAQLLRGERLVHMPDASALHGPGWDGPRTRAAREAGLRALLMLPLRKDSRLLGYITANRHEPGPFTEKQIALLQNFAEQAVIAMENARLLGELRQRTDEVAELNRGLEMRVAEQVEELGRVGRLKRFLAPQLAELIVSQGDEKILESHRREIVVVFCDLRGYTAFTETAEPEEVLDFLREYHGALGPLVSQFEGTLDQFSGDGIMVFFNDPVPCPDPAERAVKMAMAMREEAGKLIADWRERGRDLGFGAGIAQGYATLGQIGFSERSGYTAIGTVCNVAARLCAEAKDGQILVSQRINVALKGSVTTEQLGPLALKGLTQPVVAYNVPLAATQPALRVIEGGPQSI